jgi:hypothetical protein
MNASWAGGDVTTVLQEVRSIRKLVCDPRRFFTDVHLIVLTEFYYVMRYYKWWVLIPVCYIGNGLALIGSVPNVKASSANVYMMVLAVSETLQQTIKLHSVAISMLEVNDLYCKLMGYMGNIQLHFNIYIVVLLSVERVIAVTMPIKAAMILSVRRSVVALACLVVFCVLATCYTPIYIASIKGSDERCYYMTSLSGAQSLVAIHIWTNIMLVYCPFFILIVCNTTIIFTMVRTNKSRRKIARNLEQRRTQMAKDRQITTICLSVSFMFLILCAPYMIWDMFRDDNLLIWGWQYEWTCEHAVLILIVNEFLLSLYFLNNCVNGYLYCLSSSTFRANVKHTILKAVKACLNRRER